MEGERESGQAHRDGGIGRVNRLYAVLSNVNEAMVRIHEPQRLYEAACRIAVEDGNFVLAWIGFVDPDSGRVRWVAKYGRDDGYLDTVDISLDENVPQGRGPTGVALREGRAFINNDTENNLIMLPWRDEQLRRGYRSTASFPLKTDGRTIGVITLYAGEPDYFDEEEVRLLECLADDFSFAIEAAEVAQRRSEAEEALRRSHDELEARVAQRTASLQALLEERGRQARYADALDRINASIHSTLDFDEIMRRVVVDIARALEVDAAVVQVHREGHWEFAYEHGLPEELRSLRLADSEVPLSMEVLRTRAPLVVNDVAHDDRVNPVVMEQFGITALVIAPLVMRGEVFGVVIADRFGEPVSFAPEQVEFLQKAATTLALALENARLYGTEHRIAQTLQEALLTMPERLSGIDFAHAYRSATEYESVGGDFYDIFEIEPGRVGIVVGDISGKGLQAAVLTSRVKNVIHAYAVGDGKGPAEIMTLANTAFYKSTTPEQFATVFFGMLDVCDGRLVYSNAGHTTGAIVGGAAISQLRSTGTVLGAVARPTFAEKIVHLGKRDVLFLYTDGLTEARCGLEQFGEERLFDTLVSVQSADPTTVVSRVTDRVDDFTGGDRRRDDVALLALRLARD